VPGDSSGTHVSDSGRGHWRSRGGRDLLLCCCLPGREFQLDLWLGIHRKTACFLPRVPSGYRLRAATHGRSCSIEWGSAPDAITPTEPPVRLASPTGPGRPTLLRESDLPGRRPFIGAEIRSTL